MVSGQLQGANDKGQGTADSSLVTPHSSLVTDVVRLKLLGANANAAVTGLDEQSGKANYFIGKDPSKWRTNVPLYGRVKYEGVYPGIDLVYYGNQQQLEYDFVVAPGADPSAIRLSVAAGLSRQISVADSSRQPSNKKAGGVKPPLQIDANGDLVIQTASGEVRFRKPVVYQPVAPTFRSAFTLRTTDNGPRTTDAANPKSKIRNRKLLDGHFVLRSITNRKSQITNYEIAFKLGAYDHSRPLVIDPTLTYSTFLGGINGNGSEGLGIAVDASGDAFVTGLTTATNFPTTSGAYLTSCSNCPTYLDAFVTELNPSGSQLVYSTYLGGSSPSTAATQANAIALDSSGDAYIVGTTAATDFPVTPGAYQTPLLIGSTAAFVTKFNPTGSGLVYSALFPYFQNSAGNANAIAVDSAGDAYITGYANFLWPTTPGALWSSWTANPQGYISELKADGSALAYSTFVPTGAAAACCGGNSGQGIAVDSSGNIYVSGYDSTQSLVTTPGAYQTSFVGDSIFNNADAFVQKINPSLTPASAQLVYSTYLGSFAAPQNGPYASPSIALDSANNVYVTGRTKATNFPVTAGAFQPASTSTCNGCGYENAFFSKLIPDATVTPASSQLVYSTYLAGNNDTWGTGIAVDSSGNAYITGQTTSTNFPLTANAIQSSDYTGSYAGYAAFVAEFNPAASGASSLLYSSYLGATVFATLAYGYGVALDSSGNVYLTGTIGTNFTNTGFPTTPGAFQPSYPGGTPAFVVKMTSPTSSAAPGVSANPTSLNFGNQLENTASAAQTISITNSGTADLYLGPTFSGPNASDFSLSSNTCSSAPVLPSASCSLSVTFKPTTLTSESATLTLNEDFTSPPATVQTVSLSGTGVNTALTLAEAQGTSFGNQPVNTTSSALPVTLTNTGSTSVTFNSISTNLTVFTAPASGSTCSLTTALNAGSSCTINVTFTPTTTGSFTGMLTVADTASGSPQTVTFTGTGAAPTFSPTPSSLASFGNQLVGTPSAAETLTVTNTGSASLIFNSATATPPGVSITGTNASEFTLASNSCTGATLAPTPSSGTCAVSLTFTPSAMGAASATLTFTDNNNGVTDSTQTFALAGNGTEAIFSPSATSLSFGSQLVGTPSAAQTVTITNTGNISLTFSSPVALGGTNVSEFAIASDSCSGASVAANGTCAVSVTFTPSAAGAASATLTFTDNSNGVSSSTQTVALSGTGVAPIAAVAPASLTFGATVVGATSPAQTVTLSNTGTAALTITGIAASANFGLIPPPLPSGACSTSTAVAAGASCSIAVTFTPTVAGSLTGTLTITDNSNGVLGSTQTVSLTGTGTTIAVKVSPTSLSFGGEPIGATSAAQNVAVSNIGTSAVTFLSIGISANFAPAPAPATTCSTSAPLAGGSSCIIAVTFTPTASGSITGVLTITDNDPSSPQTVALSGTGQDFTLTAPTTSLTVPAGLNATYSLWLTPHDGFAGTVALSCSGAPSGSTCTAKPASVTVNGSVVTMAALDVTTTAPSLAPPRGPAIPPLSGRWPLALGLLALLMIAALPLTRSGKSEHPLPEGARAGISRVRWAILAATVLSVAVWAGCGGGAAKHVPTGGTPAGTYSLTVTAASGNLSHTTTLTLIVK